MLYDCLGHNLILSMSHPSVFRFRCCAVALLPSQQRLHGKDAEHEIEGAAAQHVLGLLPQEGVFQKLGKIPGLISALPEITSPGI